MSGAVAYLTRSGDLPRGVRLIADQMDVAWTARPAEPDTPAPDGAASIADAARWLAESLSQARASLDVLCVDAEGGICSWISAPSAEPTVVAAAFAQSGVASWGGTAEATEASVGLAEPTAGDSTIQALADPVRHKRPLLPDWLKRNQGAEVTEPSGERLPILTLPDASTRLLVDALDRRSQQVGEVLSIWHAIARAWDPSAPRPRSASEGDGRIVATEARVTAVMLVDPAGRLIWAWSREGQILTCGTLRLAVDPAQPLAVYRADVARLTADWIAWSMQVGVAPSRVACISPELEAEGSLSPADLGAALTRSWPGATVDLAIDPDPIGTTMRRLAGTPVPGTETNRAALVRLTNRPGGAHRRLYLWATGAIVAAAAMIAVYGFREHARAGAAAREAETLKSEADAGIVAALPESASSAFKFKDLENRVNALRVQKQPASGMEPPLPMLQELGAIAMVLAPYLADASSGVELDEINMQYSMIQVSVIVPKTEVGEGLGASMRAFDDEYADWKGEFLQTSRKPGKFSYRLSGWWRAAPPVDGGGGA